MKSLRLSSIVDNLLSQSEKRDSIRLAVGELILDETQLQSEWKDLTSATPLANVALDIRAIPARQQCMTCFLEYRPLKGQTACPQCGGVGAKILSGEEFYLEED